ncbi:MAG: PAS domain S-box protein [candidate division Zixibacteria bacterium]|nr:PAS domain S-box protein [candidate division Zixibacteria bacterium]
MPLLSSKILLPIYIWLISSLYRILAGTILFAAIIIVIGYYTDPIYGGLVAAFFAFVFAIAAYQVRNSGAALNYPGIDRFFQGVPCYLSIQDKDLRIIRTNRLFRRDFGSQDGEYCYKAYKGADEACSNCPVIKTFEDGQTHTTQEIVITQDGKKADVIVYTTPVNDEQGKVVGVMEMATNITEVKELHNEIDSSRKEYKDLFNGVPCYLSTIDKDFKILRVNTLFAQEFGGKPGEYCYKVYKNRDTVCSNCHVAKTLEDGEIHSQEKTVTKLDGTEARLIVYSSPIYNREGEMTAVMEMATEITELKNLQDIVKQSESRYRHLFEGVPCYISIQDKNLKIIDSNKRFKEVFGDKEGTYCYEIYKKRGEVCPDCPVLKTFEDGQVHSREETVINRDGTKTDTLVHSSPIYDNEGKCVAVMEVSTDITEVKKLQKDLTYMGQTVAVMAHRIKNILMGLEGGIFVVNTGFDDSDQETVKKGWEMIERNVEKVSRIVKDLLYCSKEREMKFETINPQRAFDSVHNLFKDKAAQDNISLTLDIPEELPEGRFDYDAIHSLLTNLVTNALDACINDAREDKTDSHRIILRATIDTQSNYRFEVEDNGPGIPGHVGESVFDDFFSTKGREGTGLGLLVANKVVEEHGGTITFKSQTGEGTTFRAIIPVTRAEENQS